eukprot:scaffold105380_cov74-Phaeocystis_antarctica.AAC.2
MESAALRATTRRRVTRAQLPSCPPILRLAHIYSVRVLAGTSARRLARRSRPTGSCEKLMVQRPGRSFAQYPNTGATRTRLVL